MSLVERLKKRGLADCELFAVEEGDIIIFAQRRDQRRAWRMRGVVVGTGKGAPDSASRCRGSQSRVFFRKHQRMLGRNGEQGLRKAAMRNHFPRWNIEN